MNMPRWLIAPFAAALVLLAVACGGDDKDNDSANASTGGGGSATSRELNLANAAQALEDVESFRFDLAIKMDVDAPSTGNDDEDALGAAFLALLSNISMSGSFVGPDSYEFKTRFFGQDLQMVQIGDQAWINEGSGWELTDAKESFFGGSPTDFAFDMLPDEVLKNATVKSEKVNGLDTTRYSFDKASLMSLAQDLGEDMVDIQEVETMNLDVWVTKDNLPVKVVMNVKGEAEGARMDVQVDFNIKDINDAGIKIQKPI
jgi:hypothetical protein